MCPVRNVTYVTGRSFNGLARIFQSHSDNPAEIELRPCLRRPQRKISERSETFRRAARTSLIAAIRKYSVLSKASHADRLSDQIRRLREKASGLPAGDERDALLRKAEQDEIALRLIEWITSPGQLAPPEDLIPIRRHRLRRNDTRRRSSSASR